METSPVTEGLSYGTSQPMNHPGFNTAITSSPKQEGRTEDIDMEPIISSGEHAAILAKSEKNGTIKPAQHSLPSIDVKPLSTASSLMIQRIVQNESLLIWQAYDNWRQKFPRLEHDEMFAVHPEPDLESDAVDDESLAAETLAEH